MKFESGCIALPISSLFLLGILCGVSGAEENSPSAPANVPIEMQGLFKRYCVECHGPKTAEAEQRFDALEAGNLEGRLERLNAAHEQLHFERMPPADAPQPTPAERAKLNAWIAGLLRSHQACKLDDKLRLPEYGNVVNHEQLFSGGSRDLPGFTPDRRWLISEFIFDAKFNKLLEHHAQRKVDGKLQSVIGDNGRNNLRVNLTNPFLLPTHSGVRYYDTTALDGGHLLTMLTNAKEASAYLISLAKRKNLLPAVAAILGQQWEHEKILAARESYLIANVEPVLRELYKEKHERLLPVYVASKPAPPVATVGPDGKALKKAVFDIAKPSNEELDQVWAGVRKHSLGAAPNEAMVLKCEQDWFYFGVNERTIQLRVAFMRNYIDELSKRMPKQNANVPKPPAETELAIIRTALQKHRQPGDTYSAIIAKCMSEWSTQFEQERAKTSTTDEAYAKLVDQLFTKIIERSPTPEELAEYLALTKSYASKVGNEKAIERLLQTLILRTDFVYRYEFGEGDADEHGRKMLAPREASYALAYALTDSSPDKELQEAVKSGKLNTREDYRREVERMLKNRSQYYIIDEAVERIGLNDSFTNIPIRKLRFFREFFGYPAMLAIFKDNKRFGGDYTDASARLVSEADMLVAHILEQDQNVIEKLLGTEEFYVYHSGDNRGMTNSVEHIRKIYEYFKDKDWKTFDAVQVKEHEAFLRAVPIRGVDIDTIGAERGRQDSLRTFKIALESYMERFEKGNTSAVPFPAFSSHAMTEAQTRTGKQMRGSEVVKSFNFDMANWNYPATQPAKIENRRGILTHPAWLIAFAGNTATDPIRRGKWVREKLLAGTIPDVPVTVDAVIPEDPHKTLRQRVELKTADSYCAKCHDHMNPLGLPFEIFDDFGRFRTEESLEYPDNLVKKMPDKGPPHVDLRDIYKTLPVNAAGKLVGTGDANLDGEVKDAIDLTARLAKSTKVRQSIIRHAFRYYMGRNEVLSDSKTLIDADQAYVQSGGSFDAVIVSLLTSDSFIYRKSVTN